MRLSSWNQTICRDAVGSGRPENLRLFYGIRRPEIHAKPRQGRILGHMRHLAVTSKTLLETEARRRSNIRRRVMSSLGGASVDRRPPAQRIDLRVAFGRRDVMVSHRELHKPDVPRRIVQARRGGRDDGGRCGDRRGDRNHPAARCSRRGRRRSGLARRLFHRPNALRFPAAEPRGAAIAVRPELAGSRLSSRTGRDDRSQPAQNGPRAAGCFDDIAEVG